MKRLLIALGIINAISMGIGYWSYRESQTGDPSNSWNSFVFIWPVIILAVSCVVVALTYVILLTVQSVGRKR